MYWTIYCSAGGFLGLICGIVLAKSYAKNSMQMIKEISLKENIEAIFNSAHSQRKMILEEARIAAKEQYESEANKLELERETIIQSYEIEEQKINERQSEVDQFANELIKKEEKIEIKRVELQNINDIAKSYDLQNLDIQEKYGQQLEAKTETKKSIIFQSMSEELIHGEKLGVTRWLMENSENLKSQSQNFAKEALSSVYLRYQPRFIWPKSSFTVPIPSSDLLKKYFTEDSPYIQLLVAGTESTVSVLTINDDLPSLLKISGGSGVDKEIIRLTLEEIISRDLFQEEKVKNIIEKHRTAINKLTLKMGDEAIQILGLKPVHAEIAKLIGALNYRTSHRQNQYFHSLEVARLAGMIANEIGIDPMVAKRSGILHDIGKALDYKIEGSHAVISADYATRYGESEEVVDTVLAHHDDKLVETANAYILKAADAMSGARPGARVDMEEGYHRRIDGISGVVNSFQELGVAGSAIMHAGREVHVFVDNNFVKEKDISGLAEKIALKLEEEVEYPGQIRVTVIRRTEITEVA